MKVIRLAALALSFAVARNEAADQTRLAAKATPSTAGSATADRIEGVLVLSDLTFGGDPKDPTPAFTVKVLRKSDGTDLAPATHPGSDFSFKLCGGTTGFFHPHDWISLKNQKFPCAVEVTLLKAYPPLQTMTFQTKTVSRTYALPANWNGGFVNPK